MKGDDNPSVTRAKMIALLSLLDVLSGDAQMSAVAIDRVGRSTGGTYAGKLRLKFSVFGDDARLIELSDELTTHEDAARALVERAIDMPSKIRFAMDRIDAWTEVVRRLLAAGAAPKRVLGEGQHVLPKGDEDGGE